VDLLVGPFAVQAPGTVYPDAMLVLEVDDLPCGRSPGFVLRELVYDRGYPAVLLHCRALVMVASFRAVDESTRGIVSTSLDA
jgi:hypothetical protein